MHSLHIVVAGLLVFGVIVFIHELGHYLAARWRRIQVDVFSIGFGPALVTWHDRVGTRWQISLLPLGGYVKLHGFDGRATTAEDRQAQNRLSENEQGNSGQGMESNTLSYHHHPLFSRALVTVMGPVFNFGLTILIFIFLFSFYGRPHISPDIATVMTGSAAERAGMHVGDRLVSLNGHALLGVPDFQSQIVVRPGAHVTLGIMRQEQKLTLPVTLQSVPAGKKNIGRLGVSFAVTPAASMPIYKAIPAAFVQVWDTCVQILHGVWQMIVGERSARQLSGTLGIIHMSGEAADQGGASLLAFIAMLSLNLGLINLFPVPVLDGGHLVFYAFEGLCGRPLPEKAQSYAMMVGIVLIASLFFFSTYNDLNSLGVFRWLSTRGG